MRAKGKNPRRPLNSFRPRDLGALALAVARKTGGHHGNARKEEARKGCRGRSPCLEEARAYYDRAKGVG